jgi:hypothetical protein
MTGRRQTLPWWLGGGVKRTAKKINRPCGAISVQVKKYYFIAEIQLELFMAVGSVMLS